MEKTLVLECMNLGVLLPCEFPALVCCQVGRNNLTMNEPD